MISCWGSNCSTTAWGQNNCSTDIALEDNLTEIVTSMMKQISDNFKTTFNITSGNLFQAEAATEERMHQDKGAALIQQQTCCSRLDFHCVYNTHCILYTCTYCTDWLDKLQELPSLACCMWAHIIQCCSMWAAHIPDLLHHCLVKTQTAGKLNLIESLPCFAAACLPSSLHRPW